MIKNWILNKFFSRELAEATRQGSTDAFVKAREDVMETIEYDTDQKAEELSEKRLISLLLPVDPRCIVRKDKRTGRIYIGDDLADDAKLNNLKAEAEFFLESDLWKLINETPKELAQQAMFVSGESLDDMKKGKSMLYLLSVQKNIVDLLKSG